MSRIILSAKDINGLKSITNGWVADNMIQKKNPKNYNLLVKNHKWEYRYPTIYSKAISFLKEGNLKVMQRKECIYV